MLKRLLVTLLVLVALMISLAWLALQPRVADHFGYALGKRLPEHIFQYGRRYIHGTGAGWCKADLQRVQAWPPRRVGTVLNLRGAPYAIMDGRPAGPYVSTILFVPTGRQCYAVYALEGGP